MQSCCTAAGQGEERQGRVCGGDKGREILQWLSQAEQTHLLAITSEKDSENSKLSLKTPSPAPAQALPRMQLLPFSDLSSQRCHHCCWWAEPGTGSTGHGGSFWQLLKKKTQNLPKNPIQCSSSFQTTKSRGTWEIPLSLVITKRQTWTANGIVGHISWCSFSTKHKKQCFIFAKNPTYHFLNWPYFFQCTHELMTAAQGFPINDIPQHFTNTGLSCSSISSAWINLCELMLWLCRTHLPLLTCTYIPWLLVKE